MSPARLGASLEDCRDCGRCCFDEDATYLPVFFVDLDRMSERTRAFTREADGRSFMALREGRCAALTIDPVAGRFVCGIYEERPDVCRALERGSAQCLGYRETKAERPKLALLRVRASP